MQVLWLQAWILSKLLIVKTSIVSNKSNWIIWIWFSNNSKLKKLKEKISGKIWIKHRFKVKKWHLIVPCWLRIMHHIYCYKTSMEMDTLRIICKCLNLLKISRLPFLWQWCHTVVIHQLLMHQLKWVWIINLKGEKPLR